MEVRDETTARLDELTSLADETLDFYRDLTDRLEDPGLRQQLGKAIDEQSLLISRLNESRQSHGELPQIGDAERGHLLAMLTTIRALAAQNDSPVVERIVGANRDLCEVAEHATECSLRADAREFVEAFLASCRSLDDTLQRRV